jgi:hypothetical protein
MKRKSRNDRRNHIDNMAQHAEEAMGKQDIKTVYNITKQLSRQNPTHQNQSKIKVGKTSANWRSS